MSRFAFSFVFLTLFASAQVPKGAVTKHSWSGSKIFPGTVRDYWIYVPAQYNAQKAAAVMVFQDGAGFVNENGAWKTPAVFDQLIAEKAMPVTIGVFIDPGVMPARGAIRKRATTVQLRVRRHERRYARFLIDEILPEVAKTTTSRRIRTIAPSPGPVRAASPRSWRRGTGPMRSGESSASSAATSTCAAANQFPSLIRKMEPKPLRVFLQDGSNDQKSTPVTGGRPIRTWPWRSNTPATTARSSPAPKATTASTVRHFADALKWLWRGYPEPIRKSTGKPGAERHYITEILDPSADWNLSAKAMDSPEGPAVDETGTSISSMRGNRRSTRWTNPERPLFAEKHGRCQRSNVRT